MLTTDQAKALLAQHRDAGDELRRLREIAGLDEAFRAIAYALIGHDATGALLRDVDLHNYSARSSVLAQRWAFEELDRLTPVDRTTVLTPFFPTIASAVADGWDHLKTFPYLRRGTSGGFFRAPSRPEVTRESRGGWLVGLMSVIGQYHEDLAWYARHAPYFHDYRAQSLGLLLASVIDRDPINAPEVVDILMASARGEDEIGAFGRHIPTALLAATHEEGWTCVARLLLGAQREEGVRQTILDALQTAAPGALCHILEVISEHQLMRFSAVTRAINQWLDTNWDSSQSNAVGAAVTTLRFLLHDDEARHRLPFSGTGEETFLALWASANYDIASCVEDAALLLSDDHVARRYAGARMLTQIEIPESTAALLRGLDDSDMRVLTQAATGLQAHSYSGMTRGEAIQRADATAFERLEATLAHTPRSAASTEPLLWNVPTPAYAREHLADLLVGCLDSRDPTRLIPHVSMMSHYGRVQAARSLATRPGGVDAAVRTALLTLAGDRASWVSEQAIDLLGEVLTQELDNDSLLAIEHLLGRRSEALRRGVLPLLLKWSDDQALDSADRLLASRSEPQRLAGLELLRLLVVDGRSIADCVARAKSYQSSHPALTAAERALLDVVLDVTTETPVLEDALGLAPLDQRSSLHAPKPRPYAWTSPAAIAGLLSLDACIHEHRMETYRLETHRGFDEVPLVESYSRFPRPWGGRTIEEDRARLPFASLWLEWAQGRGAQLRDDDGLELLRMLIQLHRQGADETRAILADLGGPMEVSDATSEPRLALRYRDLLETLCWWLLRLIPLPGAPDFLLDHLETTLTEIPERELRDPEDPQQRLRYRQYQKLQRAVAFARTHLSLWRESWRAEQLGRLYSLLQWSVSLPQEHLRYRPSLIEALMAHAAGAAREVDLLYLLLGPRPATSYGRATFAELSALSSRKPDESLAPYPVAQALYRRSVERVLEIELARGQMPTAATPAALSLRSLQGAETFVRVLSALGDESFARGYSYNDTGRSYTLSHLLRITFPTSNETVEGLRQLVQEARLSEGRLVEASVYAPQWAHLIEEALGWSGLAESVWWVHAHTKDHNWQVEAAIRDEWAAAISQWTPLASEDLADGAVDVAWFHSAYATLGTTRWEHVYRAAKYSSGGAGHARARLFADAMLNRLDTETLSIRIKAKRSRDAACALGLVPLPTSRTRRERELLNRYRALQEFVRTAQTFGAQRREGDVKAANLGIANLARTAGHTDTARFHWAMELQEAQDLASGTSTVTRGAVSVTLFMDALGEPQLTVEKAGKTLKAIPTTLKKDPEIAALRERKQHLERQAQRMRHALEQAMYTGDTFTVGELIALTRHPLLAPMLKQVVFVASTAMGYFDEQRVSLLSLDGEERLAENAVLRMAHPHDLYQSGAWSRWQHECFANERIQPFKQVFREYYPLTAAERQEETISRRYAGQQIQPQQALALLSGRGWVTNAYNGEASRTFHRSGITVSVEFLAGVGTAAAVEGLTIETVVFRQSKKEWSAPLPLIDVSPVIFSEAMRDLDLVVTVAHRGGVDPEGSASTVEMRSALLREVCLALKLQNVRMQERRCLITGIHGEYSVHLASGTVHRLPGGSLCIVPVHAQQRGRIFLPFADDDPKTAEIVSKVLLLARDGEIKDPLILEQMLTPA
jgi:hypothetical protein